MQPEAKWPKAIYELSQETNYVTRVGASKTERKSLLQSAEGDVNNQDAEDGSNALLEEGKRNCLFIEFIHGVYTREPRVPMKGRAGNSLPAPISEISLCALLASKAHKQFQTGAAARPLVR